jgi:hypothetical protein
MIFMEEMWRSRFGDMHLGFTLCARVGAFRQTFKYNTGTKYLNRVFSIWK